MRLFLLELRLLARERAAWVLCAWFGVALAWGLWNGARLHARQQAFTAELRQASEQFHGQVQQALAQQPLDPRAVARGGSLALLPAAPLPWLAIGQTDIAPRCSQKRVRACVPEPVEIRCASLPNGVVGRIFAPTPAIQNGQHHRTTFLHRLTFPC